LDGDTEHSTNDSMDGESLDGKGEEGDLAFDDSGDLCDVGDHEDTSQDVAEMVEEAYHAECVYLDYPALDLGTLVPRPFTPSRPGMDCGENCRQVSITDDDILMADYDVWGQWLVLGNRRVENGHLVYSRIYLINLDNMNHLFISSEDVDKTYPHGFDELSGIGYTSIYQNHIAFIRIAANLDYTQKKIDMFYFDFMTYNLKMIRTHTGDAIMYHARDLDLHNNFLAFNEVKETFHEKNYLLDIETREECLISVTGCCTVKPKIYGRNVVFPEGVSSYGVNIYLYNIDTKTTSRLVDGPGDHYYPQIWENLVVWTDTRNGGTSMSQENADVFMMDLTTGVETPICTNPASQPSPAAIWGTKVVWPDCRNDPDYPNVPSRARNWDLYMYDISTGTETQLTSMPGWEFSPRIYENKVYFIMKDSANIDSVFEITLE